MVPFMLMLRVSHCIIILKNYYLPKRTFFSLKKFLISTLCILDSGADKHLLEKKTINFKKYNGKYLRILKTWKFQ